VNTAGCRARTREWESIAQRTRRSQRGIGVGGQKSLSEPRWLPCENVGCKSLSRARFKADCGRLQNAER
jgi:hypothetical protein